MQMRISANLGSPTRAALLGVCHPAPPNRCKKRSVWYLFIPAKLRFRPPFAFQKTKKSTPISRKCLISYN
jgi:hypothetical protein